MKRLYHKMAQKLLWLLCLWHLCFAIIALYAVDLCLVQALRPGLIHKKARSALQGIVVLSTVG